MGYEVLDTDGARRELPSTPVPPSEVVAYDALPAPDAPGDASDPQRSRSPVDRWRVTAAEPLHLKQLGLFPVAFTAVVLLLVGWAVGGSLATRRAEGAADAERASRLAVVATVTHVDTVSGSRVADFTVRLANAGPLPVALVLSPDDARPTTTTPLVRPLGGAAIVPAGGNLSASLRLAVDCTRYQDVRGALRVPLRTSDGVVHRLPVSDDGAITSNVYGGSPCTQGLPTLDAGLAGTIDHPLLRLRNSTTRPMLVRLDLEGSPFVAQSKNFSVLRLQPDLPQVVPPGGRRDLAITLVPWSCPAGLSVILGSQVSPYIVLLSGYPGAGELAQDRIGVDLSALWGAALARNCS